MIEELKKEPKKFAYFQALRLLWLANQDKYSTLNDLINRGLLIKSSPDLAFPAADLTAVEELGDRHSLTVTFMGLSGAASPLPPFYAQEILADVLNEDYGSSLLVNLISMPSYQLHATAFFHNQLAFRLMEVEDPDCWAMINAFIGLGDEETIATAARDEGDLACLGLLASQVRSPDGLLAFVAGRFHFPVTEINQCVLRWVAIPVEQRLVLGGDREFNALGGTVLGRKAPDVCGQFSLTIPVTDRFLFESLKPGGHQRVAFEKTVDRYLNSPLVYSLKVIFSPGVVPGLRLGRNGSLGRWACLAPPEDREIIIFSQAAGTRGGHNQSVG
ncbi:MAG: type VI secretion system baseplate subunit TssG [Deltaproteobacteria bacterium]|jgi:type VI secretion system protein ImpH|nr:type VI secretion system baseplate subunit TssG [Deltaproteobacteria bacterium]